MRCCATGSLYKQREGGTELPCGLSYASGSRFCCAHCREAFDAGFLVYVPLDVDKFYSLPKASIGFRINCKGCGRPFDSCGWNRCSIQCKREHRRRRDLQDELKDSPFRTIKRKCAACGADIPTCARAGGCPRPRNSADRGASGKETENAGWPQGQSAPFGRRNCKKVPGKWASPERPRGALDLRGAAVMTQRPHRFRRGRSISPAPSSLSTSAFSTTMTAISPASSL